MTAEIEGPFASGGGIGADEPSVSLADHLDVSAPRCVWDLSRLRTDSSDDQVAIRQWGHGLFALRRCYFVDLPLSGIARR